jgi:hypothetical protein
MALGFRKVVPAIFRPFLISVGLHNTPINYGWHELEELCGCVNSLMREWQGPQYDKLSLLGNYWFLHSGKKFIWCDGNDLYYANRPGEVGLVVGNVVAPVVYVPAGWGLAVIEALKRRVVRVERDNMGLVWGCRYRSTDKVGLDDLIRRVSYKRIGE